MIDYSQIRQFSHPGGSAAGTSLDVGLLRTALHADASGAGIENAAGARPQVAHLAADAVRRILRAAGTGPHTVFCVDVHDGPCLLFPFGSSLFGGFAGAAYHAESNGLRIALAAGAPPDGAGRSPGFLLADHRTRFLRLLSLGRRIFRRRPRIFKPGDDHAKSLERNSNHQSAEQSRSDTKDRDQKDQPVALTHQPLKHQNEEDNTRQNTANQRNQVAGICQPDYFLAHIFSAFAMAKTFGKDSQGAPFWISLLSG